jgi:small subunit ribosomal protein S20
MPIIKSAIKRVEVTKKKTAENKVVKSKIATLITKFKALIASGNVAEAEKMLPEVSAYIDSACSKGVLHINNAARKKSTLNSALNDLKAKSAK